MREIGYTYPLYVRIHPGGSTMGRATRDQVLATLQSELEAATNAGRGNEIADIGILIRHYTQRPLKETDAYIRDVRLANGRQRQRRWRGSTSQASKIYAGDWIRVPSGELWQVNEVKGHTLDCSGPPGTPMRTCPAQYATRVDGPAPASAPAGASAPAACEVCPLVVAVADAFYHTIADVLEAGLTPASADALQTALDVYEAAITALGQ